jgi:molecular chaperone GrpE
MSDDAKPVHPAVEGPEASLEDVRHPEAASSPAPEPLEAPTEEPSQEAGASEALAAEVDALREEVSILRAKLDELEPLRAVADQARARETELTDQYKRLAADFDNFRRRSRDEVAAAAGKGKEQLLKALLPVLDNLDLALQHTEDQGLRLLARSFHDALAGQGVELLTPEGEAFDAKLHEAIGQEEREGVKSGTVVTVAQKGYAFEGRVLRPARVIVAA